MEISRSNIRNEVVNQEDDMASEKPFDQNEVVKNDEPQVTTKKDGKKRAKR